MSVTTDTSNIYVIDMINYRHKLERNMFGKTFNGIF